jgi:hypothetical protein
VVFLPVSTNVSEDTNDICCEVRESMAPRSVENVEAQSFVWGEIKFGYDLLPASLNTFSLPIKCQVETSE